MRRRGPPPVKVLSRATASLYSPSRPSVSPSQKGASPATGAGSGLAEEPGPDLARFGVAPETVERHGAAVLSPGHEVRQAGRS